MIITPHPYSKSEGQDHLSGTSEGLKKNGFANISLSPTSKLREDLELQRLKRPVIKENLEEIIRKVLFLTSGQTQRIPSVNRTIRGVDGAIPELAKRKKKMGSII